MKDQKDEKKDSSKSKSENQLTTPKANVAAQEKQAEGDIVFTPSSALNEEINSESGELKGATAEEIAGMSGNTVEGLEKDADQTKPHDQETPPAPPAPPTSGMDSELPSKKQSDNKPFESIDDVKNHFSNVDDSEKSDIADDLKTEEQSDDLPNAEKAVEYDPKLMSVTEREHMQGIINNQKKSIASLRDQVFALREELDAKSNAEE